jgi:hypothetical protein
LARRSAFWMPRLLRKYRTSSMAMINLQSSLGTLEDNALKDICSLFCLTCQA